MLNRATFDVGWTAQTAVQAQFACSHFKPLRGSPLIRVESEADRQLSVVNHFLHD